MALSRQSGLARNCGTFGKADRFGKAERSVTTGKHSPWGEKYYDRSRLFKSSDEIGREAGLGVGERPNYATGHKNVGPGSYDLVASRAKQRSPLDGPDFCTATIKSRTKVVVGQANPADKEAIPGPGQYEVRAKAGQGMPRYHFGCVVKDFGSAPTKVPGGQVLSRSSSSGPTSMLSKGSGSKVKTTFGMSERNIAGQPNSSPAGELYYSHIKIMQKEDYAKQVRACSLGSGQRTDFSFSQHTASPASYGDLTYYTSAAKKTSPIDGFAERCGRVGGHPVSGSGGQRSAQVVSVSGATNEDRGGSKA